MTDTSNDDQAWVFLVAVIGEPLARLMQGRLEAEDVPCFVQPLVFRAEPIPVLAFSRVKLYVAEQDLKAARAILGRDFSEDLAEIPESDDDDP